MQNAVVTISLSDVLWLAGFVVTVLGAWVAIKKVPFFTYEKRIQRLEEISEENTELNRLLCRGIKCLLTNARTGNCIDSIKKTEEEIDQFLIDK